VGVRADLYRRLAGVVLVLPPVRARGADILALATAFMQHYTSAHGVPSKRLSAEAEAWLHGYAWPGNVRELRHVMERVALLHMGEEVDAKTLISLCQPLTGSAISVQTAPAVQESGRVRALTAEAEQIRQALVQTGGNVVRAARLLGVSRDTVRYRMRRYGIERPRLEASPPHASPCPTRGAGGSSVPRRDALPSDPTVLLTPSLPQEEGNHPHGSAAPHDNTHDPALERSVSTPEDAWEHTPVAVLALELMWPATSGVQLRSYDPWTEMARQ
jgi:hypothetical protein